MGRISEPLIMELDREGKTTRRVLERIQDPHLGWKPHEKSRSVGELTWHIATTPGRVSRILSVDAFDTATAQFNNPPAQTAAELIPALEASLAEARQFLVNLDDARALAPWKMMRGDREIATMPRVAAIRSIMLNHWYHHRGELVVYLRLLNIPVPSVYGPSADEGM